MDFVNFVNFDNIGTEKLLPFPIEALPPILQEYTRAISESLQVSEDMVAVSILGVVSLCIAGKFYIQPKTDWVEPLNLYVLITARPSERKTPVLKEVSASVYEYVKEENERRKPLYNKYQTQKKILESKINNLTVKAAKASKNEKNSVSMFDIFEAQQELADLEEITMLKLLVDDITSEAMVKVMKENNERVAIVSAEGGVFGMLAGRYSTQPNIDIFLKGYSGEPYCSDRIGRIGETLDHPVLTLLLMVQPKVLQDALKNPEFRERGFMARFLYSLPHSKVGNRMYDSKPIPNEVKTSYNQLIKELLAINSMNGWEPDNSILYLNEEAYQLSKDFFEEIERKITEDYEEIEDWVGKLLGQVMRIAGILHVSKYRLGAATVLLDGQTMKDAIQIGRYFLAHAMAAFASADITETQSEKDAKYLIKKIDSFYDGQNRQNPQNLKIRDLHRICAGHFKTKEDMQPGLDELIKRGFIRITKQQSEKAGRRSEFIEVNPEYWKSREEGSEIHE